MTRNLICAIGLLLCLAIVREAWAATHYVKVSATGSGDCSSWADACMLATAVDPQAPVAQPGDSVWVMAGTYDPFALLDGVKIIGGFAGTETLASQSNPTTNVTVVDGGGDRRPVYSANHSAATMLQGFKIINGYDPYYGGGLMLDNSDAKFVQCIFEYNTAAYVGGAVMMRGGGAPQFINCIFRHNGATWPSDDPPYGGGAVFILDIASADFVNCLFHDNTAGQGGAVFTSDVPVLTLRNCTLADNHATIDKGGALYDLNATAALHNCILWGNTAVRGFPYEHQIYNYSWRSIGRTVVTYSDIQSGWLGTGNINVDPRFKNSVGNYVLQFTSPCKNVGENAVLPADVGDLDWDANTTEPIPVDLARFTRVHLGTVDMGAYEYDCQYASTDCNQSGVADACEIEADPTLDCHNNNGYPDLCESLSVVPRGACCSEEACDWPTTSCRCAASGGVWHQNMTCEQVTCPGIGIDY